MDDSAPLPPPTEPPDPYIDKWEFMIIVGCCILFGYLLGGISNITLNFN